MIILCLSLFILLAFGSEVDEVYISPIQIAFGVMVYQKGGRSVSQTLSDFHRLMEGIYTLHNHIYVVHVDVKSDQALIDGIYSDFCASKPNCFSVLPSRNVAWAGLTTGDMMTSLMQTAYEVTDKSARISLGINKIYKEARDPWQYFFLVGHESVGIASLRYIEGYLMNGIMNSPLIRETFPEILHNISNSNVLPPPDNEFFDYLPNYMHCMDVSGYDFFGQWEDCSHRLNEVWVDSFHGGELLHTDLRRNIPTDIHFYKSIQLMTISRSFVKFVCFSMESRRIMMFLTNVKTSDEMYLPTLLQMHPIFRLTPLCKTTLHFTHWIRPGGSWHPEYLRLQHLPILLNVTDQLLMRKVEDNLSRELLHAVHVVKVLLRNSFETWKAHISLLDAIVCTSNEATFLSDDVIAKLAYWLNPLLKQYLCGIKDKESIIHVFKSPVGHYHSCPSEFTERSEIEVELFWDSICSSVIHLHVPNMWSIEHEIPGLRGDITELISLLGYLHWVRKAEDQIEIDKFFEYMQWHREMELQRLKEEIAFRKTTSN